MASYHPSTWPGVRIPSVFLADGRALFDLLGKGFTLLRFSDVDVTGFVDAAATRGLPFEVLDVRDRAAERIFDDALGSVPHDTRVYIDAPASNRDALRLFNRRRLRISGSNELMYAGRKPAYVPGRIYGLASMGSCG